MPANKPVAAAKIQVFLVDDHPIVCKGFQLLLGLEPDMAVCGEAGNGSVALEKILALQPDVAIVELSIEGSSGLELIKQLRAQHSKLKILVFTMRAEAIYAERALRAGADGYLMKEEDTEKTIEAIRVLMKGKRYLSRRLTDSMMERMLERGASAPATLDSLSDRELEVLQLIGNGTSTRAIAERLHLSIKTVESHREHIKLKLGLKGATELVSYAFNWFHGESREIRTGGGDRRSVSHPQPRPD